MHSLRRRVPHGSPVHVFSSQFIFFVEACMKLAAFGPRDYFDDSWNRLDFIIVFESVVSFILDLFLSAGAGFSTSTLRLLRLLRPLRTLRFIPVRPGLRRTCNP